MGRSTVPRRCVPVLASLLLGIPANVTAVATPAERLTAAIQAGEACSLRAGSLSLVEWKIDVVKPDMFSGAAADPSLGTLWMGVAGGVAWGAVADGSTATSVASSNSYKLLVHVIGGKVGFSTTSIIRMFPTIMVGVRKGWKRRVRATRKCGCRHRGRRRPP